MYPILRPFARGEVLAPTGPESSGLDRRAIEELGVPQPVLMENAGRCAAAVLARLFPEGRVVGLIGAGNNGGDALVALRTLAAWGRDVHGVVVADRALHDPLLHGWPIPLVSDSELDDEGWNTLLGSAGVVVDGILGTGVRGAPRERQARAIGRLNDAGLPVLAVDVPSGIDSTTGAVPGFAVRADVTVAFGAPKLGSLFHPARALVGRMVVVEIAFPPWSREDVGARVATPAWARERIPRRGTDTHKNAVGRVLVAAGHSGMCGAAILAGSAVFRAGAGLVRVCSPPENRAVIQSALPEAIYIDASDPDAVRAAAEQSDAVAAGPGLGTDRAAADVVGLLVESPPVPMVLDADALNIAALGDLDLARAGRDRPLLITPHPGEMARLLAETAADSPADPATRARTAASRFGCTVLLKGAPSVVSTPTGELLIDTQSSSDLAVAGMGDTLTGVCASLLGQGLEPATTGALALYLTGRAARIAGRGASLVPPDVVRHLHDALGEPGEPSSDLDLPFVVFDADAPS